MRKLPIGWITVLGLAVLVGCSRNPQAPGKVSGRVTYKGNPVTGGTIRFFSEDKGAYSCELADDGTFEIADIPTGKLTVTVETEHLNPSKKPPDYGGKGDAMYAERMAAEQKKGMNIRPKGESREAYVKIPSKYANAKTSPLTITIEPGRQVKEIELE